MLVAVLASSGSTQTTDTSLGQWLVPLPQLPISKTFPAWLQVSISNSNLVIEGDITSDQIIGRLQGWHSTATGWRASSLVFKLELFGPVPAELKLSNVNLGRDSTGLGWQLTTNTVEVNNPYYSLRINNPAWIWTQQGTWQAETVTDTVESDRPGQGLEPGVTLDAEGHEGVGQRSLVAKGCQRRWALAVLP